jgi:hypothetical protein
MFVFLRTIFLRYLTDVSVTLVHNEGASSIPREHAWKATVYEVRAVEVGSLATSLLNCKNTEKLYHLIHDTYEFSTANVQKKSTKYILATSYA